MRIFYGLLYLAVICSVLVCLRSTCLDFLLADTSGSISVFSTLLGPIVDTYFRQFTDALVLGS